MFDFLRNERKIIIDGYKMMAAIVLLSVAAGVMIELFSLLLTNVFGVGPEMSIQIALYAFIGTAILLMPLIWAYGVHSGKGKAESGDNS